MFCLTFYTVFMVRVNPLMVVMSVRDFDVAWFWINRVKFLDKLIIKYHEHDVAHKIARNFVLSHSEYTHMLIYAEDIIATPDMVKLLIEDAKEYDYPVISGVCTYDFKHDWLSVTKRVVSPNVALADQYGFVSIYDVLDKKVEYPFERVFFVGLPLTLIRYDVLQKIGLRGNRRVVDAILGYLTSRSVMHDLQFAHDCFNANIPIYVDYRVICLHFGNTTRFINVKNKEKKVIFEKATEALT